MNIIETIKAEVERQYDLNFAKATEWESKAEDRHSYGVWYEGKVQMCKEFLSFLDTLEEKSEKPNNHEGLDEAAEKYANYHPACFHKPMAESFKAGAEWQKEQMMKDGLDAVKSCQFDKIEKTIAGVFVKYGMDMQKQDMMKEAVEGEVCGRVYDHINVRFADGICKFLEPKNISHIPADVSKYKVGDKVSIVIVLNS